MGLIRLIFKRQPRLFMY